MFDELRCHVGAGALTVLKDDPVIPSAAESLACERSAESRDLLGQATTVKHAEQQIFDFGNGLASEPAPALKMTRDIRPHGFARKTLRSCRDERARPDEGVSRAYGRPGEDMECGNFNHTA